MVLDVLKLASDAIKGLARRSQSIIERFWIRSPENSAFYGVSRYRTAYSVRAQRIERNATKPIDATICNVFDV